MPVDLSISVERFPISGRFTISRGSRSVAEVIVCTLTDGPHRGRGECVPYQHYGETVASVSAAIEAMRKSVARGLTHDALRETMPPGAARNAIDCALWDLEAKRNGTPVERVICSLPLRPVTTAVTISMDHPEAMAVAARAHSQRPVIKVKVGGENDIARIHAVASSAPEARIILDANEGWTEKNVVENMLAAAQMHVALIEQPLPAGKDGILAEIPHPVPICADESVHTSADVKALIGRYDYVNIKLDKAGGLTEAVAMKQCARSLGFGVVVGCLVGTSLAMAPAVLLAQDADYVDLDGPLRLVRDRPAGLTYTQTLVSPPDRELWG